MMSDVRWSENDIINHTESIIRKEYSVDAENILNRKATAALLGQYELNEEEQNDIMRYAIVCGKSQEIGKHAREDMAFLARVLDLERAQNILNHSQKYTIEQISWATDLINTEGKDTALLYVIQERKRYRELNN